jgi:hypothetical protein
VNSGGDRRIGGSSPSVRIEGELTEQRAFLLLVRFRMPQRVRIFLFPLKSQAIFESNDFNILKILEK